jgi:hypothetical protein
MSGAERSRVDPGIVEIDNFQRVPVVCSSADEITLVTHHVDQLVLPEETLDGGIALISFFPRFDGKGHVVSPAETEPEHDVGDGIPHPIDGNEVDRVFNVFIYSNEMGKLRVTRTCWPVRPPSSHRRAYRSRSQNPSQTPVVKRN